MSSRTEVVIGIPLAPEMRAKWDRADRPTSVERSTGRSSNPIGSKRGIVLRSTLTEEFDVFVEPRPRVGKCVRYDLTQ